MISNHRKKLKSIGDLVFTFSRLERYEN